MTKIEKEIATWPELYVAALLLACGKLSQDACACQASD